MKKLLLTILALIVLSSVLVGCTKQAPVQEEVSTVDIDQATQEIDAALDADMTELNTLDAELTDLETMDLE